MSRPQVAVILVTFNAEKWIENCLQHVLSSSIRVKLYVVDNASTDKTLERLEPFQNQLVFLPQKENLGFGAANNIGIKAAKQDGSTHIFLLNQDVYVEPNTLSVLLEMSLSQPEFGILSPLQTKVNKMELDEVFYKQLPESLRHEVWKNKGLHPVKFIGAAAWFMPLKALEVVGLFHPYFYHYGEDNNLAARMRYHGYKIGVVSEVQVVHDRNPRGSSYLPAKLRSFPLHMLMDIRKPLVVSYFLGLYHLFRTKKKIKSAGIEIEKEQFNLLLEWFCKKLPEVWKTRKAFKSKSGHIP